MYAKFIAAVVGVVVLAIKNFTGLDFDDDFTSKLSDVVIAALTAFGVFRVPNK